MSLDNKLIEDVVLLYEQLYSNTDVVGEKDFFEFMKRANRDLTKNQRQVVLNLTIHLIKEGEDNVKKTNTKR